MIAVLAVLVLASPTALALQTTATTSPPEDVEITDVDGDEVEVSWSPPSAQADEVVEYNVYADGEHVATTAETDVRIPESTVENVVWVTAVTAEGESTPSEPALTDEASSQACISVALGHVPPVYVDPECDPVGDPSNWVREISIWVTVSR